jgi:glycine cleavage system H protein
MNMKGIEIMTVLFVVATIVIFLTIDWFVRSRKPQAASRHVEDQYPLRIPDGIFFAPSHTWLNLFPSGKIRLGVDDFIARLVKEPEIVLLKQSGETVSKGEPLMQLKKGDSVLTVRSPLSGEILEANTELTTNPSLLRDKLFGEGWSYGIQPSAISELKQMLIGSESRVWIRNEFQRLRNFFASLNTNGSAAPAFMHDGGLPVSGILGTMDGDTWQKLEHEFLEVQ